MTWHVRNPGLFEKEKGLMIERHPGFSLALEGPSPGIAIWTGEARFLDEGGDCLRALSARICCTDRYPHEIPLVYESAKTLTTQQCGGHMFTNGALCYGNRLDDLLKPGKITVANVVDCVNAFVASLWCYENTGKWGPEHLHADWAFIDHEINVEVIDKRSLCPCGRKYTYGECHYPVLTRMLYMPISRKTIRIPPNAPCPCDSGRKYKHCCSSKHKRENFVRFPFFMLIKYPELNPSLAKIILERCIFNNDDLGRLVRKSPIARYSTNLSQPYYPILQKSARIERDQHPRRLSSRTAR